MRLTLPAFAAVLLLAACAPTAPGDDAASASSASSSRSSVAPAASSGSSAASSKTDAASFSAPEGQPFAEHKDGFHGTVIAIGYPEIVSRPNVECSMDCAGGGTQAEMEACITGCPTHRYLFLRLVGEVEQPLERYLADNEGNSFAGDKAIGLGCVENDKLHSINFSATLGERDYWTSGDAARRLLSATAEVPVTLKLHKERSADGRGAPDCYTHFTTIDVL